MNTVRTAVAALFGSVLLAAAAQASTPESWKKLDRAETRACIKASGLTRATVSPTRIGFSDRVGYDVRLVTGTYPQRHMKGARGRMLCAYHRATGRVETQEFKGW